jgi:hypothetical protein
VRYRVEILFDARSDSDAVELAEGIVHAAARNVGPDLQMGDVDKMKMRYEYERGVLRNGERVGATMAAEAPF